jgi:hypothetical protein
MYLLNLIWGVKCVEPATDVADGHDDDDDDDDYAPIMCLWTSSTGAPSCRRLQHAARG